MGVYCSKVCNGENDVFEINMKRDRIKYNKEIDESIESLINEKVELKIIESMENLNDLP